MNPAFQKAYALLVQYMYKKDFQLLENTLKSQHVPSHSLHKFFHYRIIPINTTLRFHWLFSKILKRGQGFEIV